MTNTLNDIHYMLAEIFIHYDGLGLSMYDYPEYKTLAKKYEFVPPAEGGGMEIYMKYGDIVAYKKQIRTLIKSEFDTITDNDVREADTITDNDVREVTHDEKLELIKKEFIWGNVIKIHCIGEYQIVEYIDKKDNKTYYHGYIYYADTNHSYFSLDSALMGCIYTRHM